jgi:hypothetical protein
MSKHSQYICVVDLLLAVCRGDEPGSALGGLAPHDCRDNDEDNSCIYSDTDKANPHETNTYFTDNSGNHYILVNTSGASLLSHIDSADTRQCLEVSS